MSDANYDIPPEVLNYIKGGFKEGIKQTSERVELSANGVTPKVPVNQGVQSLLIHIIMSIAKSLGMSPADIEDLLAELQKTVDSYKSKKGEG